MLDNFSMVYLSAFIFSMLLFSVDKQYMPLEVSFAFRFHGAKWTLQISFSATFPFLMWLKIFLHTVWSSTHITLEGFVMWLPEDLIHQHNTISCWRYNISISIRTAHIEFFTKFRSPVGNHPNPIRSWNKISEHLPHKSHEQINKGFKVSSLSS